MIGLIMEVKLVEGPDIDNQTSSGCSVEHHLELKQGEEAEEHINQELAERIVEAEHIVEVLEGAVDSRKDLAAAAQPRVE